MTNKKTIFHGTMIRGVPNVDIMPDFWLRLGQAIGITFAEKGIRKLRVVLGKDQRAGNYVIEGALWAGLGSVGAETALLGPMTYSGVAYLTSSLRKHVGIMITGGNAPFTVSGVRICDSDGWEISRTIWERILRLADSDLSGQLAQGSDMGYATRIHDGPHRYNVFAKSTLPKDTLFEGLRVAVDCGNGAATLVAPLVLKELAADVPVIHDRPDGKNINDQCGLEHPEAIRAEIHRTRADLGVAFSADGSDISVFDETGSLVGMNTLFALFMITANRSLKPSTVLGIQQSVVDEMMQRQLTERHISVRHLPQKTERELLQAARKLPGVWAMLSKEGRIVFPELHTTSDGLLVVLQLMLIMKEAKMPLSAIVRKWLGRA